MCVSRFSLCICPVMKRGPHIGVMGILTKPSSPYTPPTPLFILLLLYPSPLCYSVAPYLTQNNTIQRITPAPFSVAQTSLPGAITSTSGLRSDARAREGPRHRARRPTSRERDQTSFSGVKLKTNRSPLVDLWSRQISLENMRNISLGKSCRNLDET